MKTHLGQRVVAILIGMSTMAGMSGVLAEEVKPVGEPDLEELTAIWEASLEGSQWATQLSPAAGPGKPQTDKLTFQRGTLTSQWLSKEGFAASNYTLRAHTATRAELQTNQSNPDGHVASWRGDITGEAIAGAVNKRTPQGEATVYYFNGTKIAIASIPPSPKPTPPPAETPVPSPTPSEAVVPAPASPVVTEPQIETQPAQPQATAPPAQEKKKWGWW